MLFIEILKKKNYLNKNKLLKEELVNEEEDFYNLFYLLYICTRG